MNAPVSIRDLMARLALARQTERNCKDAEWNTADAAVVDAEDELRLSVAEKLGGLSLPELRELGDVLFCARDAGLQP